MYAAYLSQSGRCAHYEPFEKHPVHGEHMSFGSVKARKLVGVTIPKEEV
jgi:hypothetical protein